MEMNETVVDELGIRHFVWQNETLCGRIAIGVVGERFRFVQLAGPAPTPQVLYRVLMETPGLLEYAGKMDRMRVHRVGVETRSGMSGCFDVLLREERDAELRDYPIVAGIHVSMMGKLNRPINVWSGDLPRLLNELRRVVPPEDTNIIVLEAPVFTNTEIFDVEDDLSDEGDFVSLKTLERLRRIILEDDDDDCPGA